MCDKCRKSCKQTIIFTKWVSESDKDNFVIKLSMTCGLFQRPVQVVANNTQNKCASSFLAGGVQMKKYNFFYKTLVSGLSI